MIYLLIGLIAGLVVGRLFGGAVRRRLDTPKPFVHTEYWVYFDGEKLPDQNAIMELLATGDAIGPQELLLFSDIRLDVALVRRAGNPHVFRPDLFENYAEPTPEVLAALSDAKSFARARFISEEAVLDDRHVRLMPYLAYALCKLGDARVLYDAVGEELMTVSQLVGRLKSDKRQVEPSSHTRVLWKPQTLGGYAETRGLVKRGLPELETEPVHSDERVIVTSLLEDAIRQLWGMASLPSVVTVSHFGDNFKLMLKSARKGPAKVRILRESSL